MIRKPFIWPLLTLLCISNTCQDHHPRTLMAVGDSNGASEDGWARQLQNKLPDDSLYNYSIPGNTVGFDNLGKKKLNTLKSIDFYLADILSKTANIDYVIILLGTNDCKAVFAGREVEIMKNMHQLISKIKAYPYPYRGPDIVLVTPPPYGPDSVLAEKYKGGDRRVEKLVPLYKKLADELECNYVDIYNPLKPKFSELSKDGVHLSAAGQEIIARLIVQALDNQQSQNNKR